MIELVKTKVEVKFEDKIYNLHCPTYKQSLEYSEAVKQASGDELAIAKCLTGFLLKLGLPEDVSESLESGHLEQILDFILSKKK